MQQYLVAILEAFPRIVQALREPAIRAARALFIYTAESIYFACSSIINKIKRYWLNYISF